MMVEYDVAVEYEFCHRCCYCRFSLSLFYCYAAEVGELLENSSHVVMVTKWQCEKWNVNMFFPTSTLFIISLLLFHTLGPLVVVLSFFKWTLHCHCRLFWCLSLCWIFNSNYLASLIFFLFSESRTQQTIHAHATRSTPNSLPHRFVLREWTRARIGWEDMHAQHFFSRNEECTTKIDWSDENFILKTLEGIFFIVEARQAATKKAFEGSTESEERQRRVKNTF